MQITRPTLLLNEQIARKNIKTMAEKATSSKVDFRPHFKTHFSAEIANWYRSEGIEKCTVSSVEMAKYFSEHGWEDITIAFPINRLEIKLINEINNRITLNVIIEDLDTLEFLDKHIENKLNYLLKLDIGTRRTGLSIDTDFNQFIISSDKLNFRGFLCHAGHTYKSRENKSIKRVYEENILLLASLKEKYLMAGQIISYGDTPSCSVVEKFDHIDEIRPGNFIFYDWMQLNISSCSFEDIAVCMACPVVALHPERQEVVLHGGAVHFSKDAIEVDGVKSFGLLVHLTDKGWSRMEHDFHLVRLSQEHGILKVDNSQVFNDIKIGDIVGILPVHSCLAANLMSNYLTLEGKHISQMEKNVIV